MYHDNPEPQMTLWYVSVEDVHRSGVVDVGERSPSKSTKRETPHANSAFPHLITVVDLALPTFRSDHLSQLSTQ